VFLSAKDRAGYPWVIAQQGILVSTDGNGFKQVRNDVDGIKTMALDGRSTRPRPLPCSPCSFLDGIRTH
jgi:hypothetical protein